MLNPKQLHAVFELKDGVLYWKIHNRKCLPGSKAGNINAAGYVDIRHQGKRYYGHRVVFAMIHGKWPKRFVDHINGNPSDNRPENLREATDCENAFNAKLKSNNTTGIKGLYKFGKGWSAEICHNKTRHRKYFAVKEHAIKWLKTMRLNLHKQFANFGDTK